MIAQIGATLVVFGMTGYLICDTLEDALEGSAAVAFSGLSSVAVGVLGGVMLFLALIWS